ncbi:phosphomannomutase [Halorubellus sp. PRR65]|uniref:phosphomannomutase n=1 Tax=Halorubellus sp. PRR65 TaxID=3098148 RepID=UPI002B258066|nr:phosphomannomutase [Halorubellus sp. PRR65]
MTLFGTAGIRGPVATRVTPELALRVGQAAGVDGAEFVVGRDGRETGAALAAALEAGLESAGADVERVGQVPTPALAYASRGRRGVMVTASHNPPEDNGIKLFVDGEEYDRAAEERVEERVESGPALAAWDAFGSGREGSVLEAYREAVVAFVRESVADGATEPLEGVTVAVDCGTGMASVATPQVLGALGADVRATNANVDGHFPARPSKPTAETLTEFSAFLAESDVDVGLAHDGDADRIVVLTPDGDVVHEDTVLAMLAEHYVRESDAADPVVVTTPNASGRIDERVDAAGGRTERVRLGALHEGIAREREAGDGDTEVAFAAEPWKHVHTAFGGWIDGVTSAGVLSALVATEGGLDALRAPVTERPYRKVSVSCPDEAKDAAMGTLADALPEAFADGDVDTDYGVRVDRPDGSWVLVRPSGTEPYVRIYAEADDVDALVERARGVVESAVESASD